MAVMTFAAIDIGSYEVSMKIFEMSKRIGFRELNDVRYSLEIGKGVYSDGKIDSEMLNVLCEVLNDFKRLMQDFGVEEYRACGTSAFRELVNPLLIIEQIYQRTGMKIEILSSAEQHFLGYKSIAAIEKGFKKMIQKGTAILDVGGGSLQVSLFDKDALVTTQGLKMGSLRIRQRLQELEKSTIHYDKLVEEFMLLANRTVAEKVGRVPKNKKAKVLPYRIHDLPDPEKLENLSQFIARFGYKVRTSGTKTDISKSINHLLDDIHGKKEENLIETVSIRAMQKARYSTHNIGHYGLAFEYYTHFTSPIRRFPDMMVHRLLTKYINGGRSVSEAKYEDLCDHSSNMEQIAANAERASIKYKQVEFMSERLGQIYDGVISGVTEWGLYVELNENKCEGLVPIRDLDDDYYEFDEKNYCLRGRRKNKIYSLGDAITVRVARANLEKKQLDFELIEK